MVAPGTGRANIRILRVACNASASTRIMLDRADPALARSIA